MNYRLVLLALPLVFLFLIFNSSRSVADTLSNGNVQMQIEEVTPTTVPLSAPTPTPKIANVFVGDNYTIDETDSSPITFLSQSDFIDYGPFTPTNPILRKSSFSVWDWSLKGFEVVALENNPLVSSISAQIPDTSCDDGSCNEIQGSIWKNTLSYGFGYSCKGFFCAGGFENGSYKRFPNQQNNKTPQMIFSARMNAKAGADVFYKVNVSGSQDASVPYQNTITFIAVPSL